MIVPAKHRRHIETLILPCRQQGTKYLTSYRYSNNLLPYRRPRDYEVLKTCLSASTSTRGGLFACFLIFLAVVHQFWVGFIHRRSHAAILGEHISVA